MCLLACMRGSSGCGDRRYQKKTNLWSSLRHKFVERARKQANEKMALFGSAGSYHCKGFRTSKIPLFGILEPHV